MQPLISKFKKKTLNGPRVREISPVRKEEVYGGNALMSLGLVSPWAATDGVTTIFHEKTDELF